MKRSYIIPLVCIIFVIAVIIRPTIFDMVLAFVFLGLIPATNLAIPYWLMLIGYFLLFIVLLKWIISQPLYVGSREKQEKTAKQLARKRVVQKTTKARQASRKTAKAKA